jgi:hypothetical protein
MPATSLTLICGETETSSVILRMFILISWAPVSGGVGPDIGPDETDNQFWRSPDGGLQECSPSGLQRTGDLCMLAKKR